MTEKEQNGIFEDWLARHKAIIFKVARAYAYTDMDRDDLFQEIAVQIWRSIPAFRHESAATTWMYRVSLNTAIRWSRVERKHNRAESLDNVRHVILQENSSSVDERLVWLYEEIHKLDEVDRSIALLMLDKFTYREMADMLGITESNVGVKINRIKKHLISKSQKYQHHGI